MPSAGIPSADIPSADIPRADIPSVDIPNADIPPSPSARVTRVPPFGAVFSALSFSSDVGKASRDAATVTAEQKTDGLSGRSFSARQWADGCPPSSGRDGGQRLVASF